MNWIAFIFITLLFVIFSVVGDIIGMALWLVIGEMQEIFRGFGCLWLCCKWLLVWALSTLMALKSGCCLWEGCGRN
jgi:hypothetical protein